MAKTFRLKILTVDKVVFDADVEKLTTISAGGPMLFLSNYAPSVVSTVPCITSVVDANGNEIELFTSTGIINIRNNEFTFCCDSAEIKEEIDLKRAEEAKERAEKRIDQPDKYDVDRAKIALLKANQRIKLHSSSK